MERRTTVHCARLGVCTHMHELLPLMNVML